MDLSNYSNEDLEKLESLILLRRKEIHINAPTFLPEDFRDKLITHLADIDYEQCYGDGQEMDHILDGYSNKGLFLYTDHELAEMTFQCTEEEDEFYREVAEHLEEYKMLSAKAP